MILVALFALLAAATARGRRLFAAALVVCAAPSPPSPLSFSVEARALTLLLARPNGATHAADSHCRCFGRCRGCGRGLAGARGAPALRRSAAHARA